MTRPNLWFAFETAPRLAIAQIINQPKVWLSLLTCLTFAATFLLFSLQLVWQVMYAPLPYDDAENRYALEVHQGPFNLNGQNTLYKETERNLYLHANLAQISTMESTLVDWQVDSFSSEQVLGIRVSESFFTHWPVDYLMGSVASFDMQSVIVDESFWRYNLGEDSNAIGNLLQIDNQWYTLIAVIDSGRLPRTQHSDKVADKASRLGKVWMMSNIWQTENSINKNLSSTELFLTSSASHSYLNEDYKLLVEKLNQQLSSVDEIKIEVISYRQALWGEWYWVAPILLFGATLLSMIALSAMANLMLANGSKELRDISLNTVLGAQKWQISIIQLTQVVLISLTILLLGYGLASQFLQELARVNPQFLSQWRFSWIVFVISWLCLSGLLWLLLSLPRLKIRYDQLAAHLSSSGKGQSGRFNLQFMKKLTLVQVFVVSVFLLLGLAYLQQNIEKVLPVLNTDYPNTAYVQVKEFKAKDLSQGKQAEILGRYANSLQKIPSIAEIAMLTADPLQLSYSLAGCSVNDNLLMLAKSAVSSNVFSMMDFKLLQGEIPDYIQPGQVIINQDAAQQLFNGQAPVGQKLPCKGSLGQQLVVAVVQTKHVLDDELEQFFSDDQAVIFNQFDWYKNDLMPSDKPTFLINFTRDIPYAALLQASKQLQTEIVLSPLELLSNKLQKYRLDLYTGIIITLLVSLATVMISVYSLYGSLSYQFSLREHELAVSQCLGMKPRALISLLWKDNINNIIWVLFFAMFFTTIAEWSWGSQAVSWISISASIVIVLGVYTISSILPCWKMVKRNQLREWLY